MGMAMAHTTSPTQPCLFSLTSYREYPRCPTTTTAGPQAAKATITNMSPLIKTKEAEADLDVHLLEVANPPRLPSNNTEFKPTRTDRPADHG